MVAIIKGILRAALISEDEPRHDATVLLYQKGLPLMKAAELARMGPLAIQHLLASRRVPARYEIEGYEQDPQALRSL